MLLLDGRTLAYTDLGSPSGPVVMYYHGAPSSRLDLAYFEDDLAGRGVRVVSADRPGFGRSSPRPGRRREGWPTDVAALAVHIGVQRFAVLGSPCGTARATASMAVVRRGVRPAEPQPGGCPPSVLLRSRGFS